MKVKKYKGKTVQDAILQVKADLGSDAIILDTRKFKHGGFLGFFKSEYVEVLAGLEEEAEQPENRKNMSETMNSKKIIVEQNNINNSFFQHLPTELLQLYEYLQKQGINHTYCEEIIAKIKDNTENLEMENIKFTLNSFLQNLIGEAAPIITDSFPFVISFVGPTGVGKTTTIAKIAADFAVNRNRKVGLITSDIYRVAAIQQIETYSKLVNLPLEVIYNKDNLYKVINNKFQSYDLVLIDTPGSSWRDHMQLGRIKSFTDKNIINEVHLILSLNTKKEDLMTTVTHFSRLEPDKILLTKLDATLTYGNIINLCKKYNIPYSYITCGQNVPDDIKVADPEILVGYIMRDFYE